MDAPKPPFTSARQSASPAAVAVRPFLLKPQRMNGLSERLLMSHYENNYGGALRRLNAIRARLAALDWAETPVFEINGLYAPGPSGDEDVTQVLQASRCGRQFNKRIEQCESSIYENYRCRSPGTPTRRYRRAG
jgi:hypothetical protein